MDFRFEVPLEVPVEEAWAGVTDLAVLAACFPGAHFSAPTDSGGRGSVTVSLGPIRFEYEGDVVFLAKDDDEHRAVITVTAADRRGGGSVSARIALAVVEAQSSGVTSSLLILEADVDVSGRAAQFGRGMLEDVAHTLLSDFAGRLAAHYRGEPMRDSDSGKALNALSLIPKKPVALAAGGGLGLILLGILVGWSLARRRC